MSLHILANEDRMTWLQIGKTYLYLIQGAHFKKGFKLTRFSVLRSKTKNEDCGLNVFIEQLHKNPEKN